MKTIAGGPKILVALQLTQGELTNVELSLFDRFCITFSEENPLLWHWLSQYAQKKQPAPLSLKLQLPAFTEKVLSKLQEIPFGSTMTYMSLAYAIDNPKAARAVGNACGMNPFPLLIPCHRVIHTNGTLGGFSSGLEIKRRLLDFEAR